MLESRVVQHVRTLNDCSQRGGRILSLVDLVDARSADIHLAAYLAAMMQRGSSLLVGANPGGAGKTAVMCACLNFLPSDMVIHVVDSYPFIQQPGKIVESTRVCLLAHEIGAGFYYAYVWGQQARDFFALTRLGYAIASNLHADTLTQMTDQLCQQNSVPRDCLDAVTLKLFLRMQRDGTGALHRWISHVYENDGKEDKIIWSGKANGSFTQIDDSHYIDAAEEHIWHTFLKGCIQHNIRTIEDVRTLLLNL